jgi:hypothetical protein
LKLVTTKHYYPELCNNAARKLLAVDLGEKLVENYGSAVMAPQS